MATYYFNCVEPKPTAFIEVRRWIVTVVSIKPFRQHLLWLRECSWAETVRDLKFIGRPVRLVPLHTLTRVPPPDTSRTP